ncbi:MAG TPA: choice-of-anchor D domain-containing protein, partial [Solirubrobacteraceae bacterium]|nr:choice-of-anchor D domain-containing protein [Solirubrobacteraceae bacterium]
MPVPSAPRVVLAALAAMVAMALLPAAPAHADDPVFDRAFGAGPADVCSTSCRTASNGSAAGQLSFPYGVTVSGGEVFVAEQNNHRISVYGTDGTFSRAFGRNVNQGSGNPDVCTAATTCRAGTSGGAAGQLSSPYAVSVSGGEVYVADASNNRISVYSTGGLFARAFGRNVNPGAGDPDVCTGATTCRAGSSGTAPGELSFPLGVGVSDGEVYVADSSNSRISVYGTGGTFARTFGTNGSAAGQLSFPFGLAVGGGSVYVADKNNHRVSEFATDGTFVKAFGKGVNPSMGNPDVCTALTTCRAGTLGGAAGQLRNPLKMGMVGGEVYVADGNHRVNVFLADGTFARAFGGSVNPGAGNPDLCTTATGCQAGSPDGAAGRLNSPAGVSVSGGEVYVADTANYRIGVYSTAGTFARAFGKSVTGSAPFVCTTVSGCGPGAAGGAAAQLNLPQGVAVAGGEAYVADAWNHRVSVYAANGTFVRAFGKGVNAGAGNADLCTTACRAGTSGTGAGQLALPAAVAVSGGEVYVAEQNNQRVSVFATDGTFVRAFGKGVNGGAGDPDVCTAATTCRAGTLGGAAGQLDNPVGLAVAGGEVYVTDQGNRRISVFGTGGAFARAFGKAVNPGGGDPDVCTAATTCRFGTQGGAAGQLDSPYGVTVSGGEAYVADYLNNRVSVFATSGVFARAFGKGVNAGSGDPDVCTASCRAGTQGGTAGHVSFPFGVGVGDGAVYVSERFNGRISVFGTDGAFARAFGKGVNAGSGNPDVCTAATTCRAAAQGDAAGQFNEPLGVGMNGTDIYVADRLNHRIAMFRVPRTELSHAPGSLSFGARDVDEGAAASQSSTVTNTGTEPVTLTGLTLSGDTAHFARVTGAAGDCATGTAILPGQTCTLRIRFDPASTGAKAATLSVASNAPPIAVALAGTGTQTELVRAPASLAFGSQDVDEGPTAPQSSTVTNSGTEAVTLSGLTLTGDAAHFARLTGAPGDCAASTVLLPGQTCTVRLRFDPGATGAKAASVTVASNAAAVAVAATGSGTQTELSRSPATLALGPRDIDDGPTVVQSSTISNSGTQPVTLGSLTLAGDAGEFARVTGGAGDCTPATVLAAGQTCAVRVRFDPTSTGAKAGTLTVASNAPPVAVALTGTGTQTQLSRTPASLAFGSRDVDTGPGALQPSAITNTGTEPVSLTGLTLTGDAADFERVADAGADCTATRVLQAGDTCSVRVRFDPASTGAKAATLTVASNAPAIAIGLSGSGVRTALSLAPSSLAFGRRDVNTGASAVQASTVSNTGTEPVSLAALTLTGDAAHFVRVTGGADDCSTATLLAAGEACTVRLRFDPASSGAKAATLTIASNAPPLTVALTGSGILTQVSSTPGSLAFGSRDIEEGPAAAQTATVANTGTESVTLTGLTLSGDAGQFERLVGAADDCTATTRLDVGETCRLRVRFDPTTTGAKSAALTVGSNAPALVVGLSGTGTTVRADTDGDGVPDIADLDDDGDGVPDDRDPFPLDPTRTAWPSPPPPAPPAPAPAPPVQEAPPP